MPVLEDWLIDPAHATIATVGIWGAVGICTFLAAGLGHLARSIQGGQYLNGMPLYRLVAGILYLAPFVITFLVLKAPGWTLNHLYLGIIMTTIGALVYRAHLGPDHGHQMDMGTVAGTRAGDFKDMVLRFAIMLVPAGALNTVGIQFLLAPSPIPAWAMLTSVILFLTATVVPALAYLVWHKIGESGVDIEATVMAEKTYAAIVQALVIAAIAIGLVT